MDILKTPPPLQVFHEQHLIGEITFDAQADDFLFKYDDQWIQQDHFLLSPHIAEDRILQPGVMNRFLENLLPEGEGLMHLARMLKVNKSNIYALISAIGSETAGALTFSADKKSPATGFRLIEEDELTERIKNRFVKPISAWDGRPRLSLAGVQEKLAVIIKNEVYGLGEGRLASTHILKFGSHRTPHLVLNEYFCMTLADAVGVVVAKCELRHFGERVLQVKRFDREWADKDRVRRIHLIDGCQALDLRPTHKYERFLGDQPQVADITGPANLENIHKFCEQLQVPAQAQLRLLQWVLFNLLIGNSDQHVKNISFFVTAKGMTLAPFYDLVSVAAYPDLEQALAFHIGDTFDPDQVNAYHLAEMANELNLKKSFIAAQLKKISLAVKKQLHEIEIADLTASESDFVGLLKKQISNRCDRFIKVSAQITEFKSL